MNRNRFNCIPLPAEDIKQERNANAKDGIKYNVAWKAKRTAVSQQMATRQTQTKKTNRKWTRTMTIRISHNRITYVTIVSDYCVCFYKLAYDSPFSVYGDLIFSVHAINSLNLHYQWYI